MDYPKELFKYRALRGIARYRQIDGNIYEDTTCKDHTNCRIRVKAVGDHYEFDVAINDAAKQHKYIHEHLKSMDSYYYTSRKLAYTNIYSTRIMEYVEKVEALAKEVTLMEEKVDTMKRYDVPEQHWENIDFDDEIYVLRKKDNLEGSDRIRLKIFDKHGLRTFETERGLKLDENYPDHLVLNKMNYDGDYPCDEAWYGFTTKEARDAYKNNLVYDQEAKALEDKRKSYDAFVSTIQGLRTELAKVEEMED